MFETKRESWINEYGYDEGYFRVELSTHMSGHLYRGSAMETDSDCGNCDGGRCDSCKRYWQVSTFEPPKESDPDEFGYTYQYCPLVEKRLFDDEEKARAYFEQA